MSQRTSKQRQRTFIPRECSHGKSLAALLTTSTSSLTTLRQRIAPFCGTADCQSFLPRFPAFLWSGSFFLWNGRKKAALLQVMVQAHPLRLQNRLQFIRRKPRRGKILPRHQRRGRPSRLPRKRTHRNHARYIPSPAIRRDHSSRCKKIVNGLAVQAAPRNLIPVARLFKVAGKPMLVSQRRLQSASVRVAAPIMRRVLRACGMAGREVTSK